MAFILATEGKSDGTILQDTDLWGLQCALIHGINDGYFKENKDWAERMVELIDSYRK
jgi:hypothetical protein